MAKRRRHYYSADSSWAWVVLGASLGSNFLNGCLSYFVGVVHTGLIKKFQPDSVTFVAFTGAMYSSLAVLAAPVASYVVNRYNCRTCCLLGGLCCFAGYTSSAFVTSVTQLFFTYGLTAGLGLGLTFSATTITVGLHFHRLRGLASGISSSFIGAGILAGSVLFQELLEEYAVSGAFLLLGALSLHFCFFGMFFRPTVYERKTRSIDLDGQVPEQQRTWNIDLDVKTPEKAVQTPEQRRIWNTDLDVKTPEQAVEITEQRRTWNRDRSVKISEQRRTWCIDLDVKTSGQTFETLDQRRTKSIDLAVKTPEQVVRTLERGLQTQNNGPCISSDPQCMTPESLCPKDQLRNSDCSDNLGCSGMSLLGDAAGDANGSSRTREKPDVRTESSIAADVSDEDAVTDDAAVNTAADDDAETAPLHPHSVNRQSPHDTREDFRTSAIKSKSGWQKDDDDDDEVEEVEEEEESSWSRPSPQQSTDERDKGCKESLWPGCGGAFMAMVLDRFLMLHCAALFLCNLHLSGVYLYLPEYAQLAGTTTAYQAAQLFFAVGGFNVLSRLCCGFATSDQNIDPLMLSFGMMGLNGVLTCLFPLYSDSYLKQLAFSAQFGLYSGGLYAMINPTLVRFVSVERMAHGYGVTVFFMGFGYAIGPLLAGLILDGGGTHDLIFLFFGFMMLLACFLEIGAAACLRSRDRVDDVISTRVTGHRMATA